MEGVMETDTNSGSRQQNIVPESLYRGRRLDDTVCRVYNILLMWWT